MSFITPPDEAEVTLSGETRRLVFDHSVIAKIEQVATKAMGIRTTIFDLIDATSSLNLALILCVPWSLNAPKGKPVTQFDPDELLVLINQNRDRFLQLWVQVTAAVRGAYPEINPTRTKADAGKSGAPAGEPPGGADKPTG